MSGVGERGRRSFLKLMLVLAVGAMLGRLGPFDTFSQLSSGERYAYWIGLTLLMWLQGVAILALIEPPLGRNGWQKWLTVVIAALLAAVPTGFEVAWAEMVLRVERDLGPIDLVAIIGDVALLSVPLLLLTQGWREKPAELSVQPEADGAGHLVTMMAPARRGSLLALASEDHYVRLYTPAGDELIAMRFRDALDRAGADGLQVHRGWWVASDAVESIERAGDGLQLNLRNGLSVPVSRSYAQQVRKAWADRLR